MSMVLRCGLLCVVLCVIVGERCELAQRVLGSVGAGLWVAGSGCRVVVLDV